MHRQRGSVYILVLGASLLIAAIGISTLMATRVRYQAGTENTDMLRARELARTAVDRGLWEVKNNDAGWRTVLSANTMQNIEFGAGVFTVGAADPIDGNLLNNNTDPVTLYGVGKTGTCRYTLSVTLQGDGTILPGTWRRVMN